jgi:cell division initiation protein
MRLTYLDILEQCFHDKFRGYNKQEVDTFLHLVADDFKSLAEDLKDKEKQIDELKQSLEQLKGSQSNTSEETKEEIRKLRMESEEKGNMIEQLKKAAETQSNGDNPLSQLTSKVLKEKAKKIFNAAKLHAEETNANANKELESLQIEIQKLQEQKQKLTDNIRKTAVEHLNKFKTGT